MKIISILKNKFLKIKKGKIMSNELLNIQNLYVNAGEKEILKGIDLKINKGEIHVIMGPNGSRKNNYSKRYFK